VWNRFETSKAGARARRKMPPAVMRAELVVGDGATRSFSEPIGLTNLTGFSLPLFAAAIAE
jgi:hypothetical protein